MPVEGYIPSIFLKELLRLVLYQNSLAPSSYSCGTLVPKNTLAPLASLSSPISATSETLPLTPKSYSILLCPIMIILAFDSLPWPPTPSYFDLASSLYHGTSISLALKRINALVLSILSLILIQMIIMSQLSQFCPLHV